MSTDERRVRNLYGEVNDISEGNGDLHSYNHQNRHTKIRPQQALISIFSFCPYTMMFTKIIRLIQGKPLSSPVPYANQDLFLKSKVQFGLGVIAIGVFCPVFWISLLTGTPKEELMMSTCSSLTVVLFGILYIIFYRHQWRKEIRDKSN